MNPIIGPLSKGGGKGEKGKKGFGKGKPDFSGYEDAGYQESGPMDMG